VLQVRRKAQDWLRQRLGPSGATGSEWLATFTRMTTSENRAMVSEGSLRAAVCALVAPALVISWMLVPTFQFSEVLYTVKVRGRARRRGPRSAIMFGRNRRVLPAPVDRAHVRHPPRALAASVPRVHGRVSYRSLRAHGRGQRGDRHTDFLRRCDRFASAPRDRGMACMPAARPELTHACLRSHIRPHALERRLRAPAAGGVAAGGVRRPGHDVRPAGA
jgi:hypothetical protein